MAEFATQNPVYGRAFLKSVLAAYKTAPTDPLVKTAKLRLSMDPAFTPTFDPVLADLVAHECDFTGYTTGGYAIVVGAPLNTGAESVGALTPILSVASATITPNQQAYGYWVDDGVNVIAMEAFPPDVAVIFGTAGDFLALDLIFPLDAAQNII